MSAHTPSPWYAIRRRTDVAAAASGVLSAAEIFIYGDIGESWYDETVSAANFVRALNELDVEQIVVRINSFGGSVSDGLAIYNAMRRHKAEIVTEIDSVAYSIASLIAMGGDKVHMASNAMLMIHAPWTYTAGNSVELRERADQLDSWASAMSTSYASRTGDQAAALALLTDGKDHYYTAEEALAGKFIDVITDALPVAASGGVRDLAFTRYHRPTAAQRPAGLPAAAAAPSPEPSMTQTPVPAAATTPAGNSPVAVDREAIMAADRDRRAGIRATFARFSQTPGVTALQQTCEDDHKCDVQAAGSKLLELLGKDSTPVAGGTVLTTEDETDKARKAIVASLMVRASIDKPAADHGANPYRGHTLYELARASLARAGRRTDGMDKMELVAAAFTHSTSDFGGLLSNVANKAMLKGYSEAEETFQLWTAKGTLPDFKPGSRVDLNVFPSLRQVPEGAEYKYATIGTRGATVVLATYGELFSITRQAIINDDLDAFSRIPRLMGRAAIRTIGDLVYAILTGNPVMADGKALFHADHGNLLPGSAITTDSVDAMAAAMALQKQGQSALNIGMEYVIVPRALRGVANVVRSAEFEVGAARNSNVPNSVRDSFQVISEARLDASSSKAWYGAASSAINDTIEVSYLDGNEAPVLEQKTGWNVDGTEFKVRMDAGVSPLDWKTLAKNPGPA